MKDHRNTISDLISGISTESWKSQLDEHASKYHITVLWVAVILDPMFGIVDYFNIQDNWQSLLAIRVAASCIILVLLAIRYRFKLPSYLLVAIGFLLISLQNSFTYSVIKPEHLLGHNLGYMALIIGTSMFVLWHFTFSMVMIFISALATLFFISINPNIEIVEFFVSGGFLLITSGIFMIVLVQTRYELTLREIKLRVALKESNDEIIAQAEEIKGINENLEVTVKQRTKDLEMKNKDLEEYAFVNAHKLRSPVASILGLLNLMKSAELNLESKNVMSQLTDTTAQLDQIVSSITKAIERGD